MRLFIVRHCERFSSPLYKSQLTEEGKIDATKLCISLYENNINKVYCSPYLRCIQTVERYCDLFNKELNIEYGFSENSLMLIKNDIDNLLENYNNNKEYTSKIDIKEINKTNYNINEVIKRIGNLLISIIEEHKHTENNILICTHQTNINIILYLFNLINYEEVIIDIKQPTGNLIEIFIK